MGQYDRLETLLNEDPHEAQLLDVDEEDIRAVADEIDRLAAASAGPRPAGHVSHQHVVSQCVLKNFTRDPKAKGSKLQDVDMTLLAKENYGPKDYSPSDVGKILDFVDYDSAGAEALWTIVEDTIPTAVEELTSAFPGKQAQHSLRAAVGLHWVRRENTQTILDETFSAVINEATSDTNLQFLARKLNGRCVTTDEELSAVRESVYGSLEASHGQGVLFRKSIDRLFRWTLHSTVFLGAMYILEAPPSAEFLISDHPVVVHDQNGVHQPSTPLFDLSSMAMPLTSRHMIQVQRDGQNGVAKRLLTRDEVLYWNALQVKQARTHVMYRPQANLFDFVRRALRVSVG